MAPRASPPARSCWSRWRWPPRPGWLAYLAVRLPMRLLNPNAAHPPGAGPQPAPLAGGRMKVLVTGIRGQDGWYLAQQVLAAGHTVVGHHPRPGGPGTLEVDGSAVPLLRWIWRTRRHDPGLIRQVAARRHLQLRRPGLQRPAVRRSAGHGGRSTGWRWPALLEAIRRRNPRIRFCQASSQRDLRRGAGQPPGRDHRRRPDERLRGGQGVRRPPGRRLPPAPTGCSPAPPCCTRTRAPAGPRISWCARWPGRRRGSAPGLQQSVTLGDLDAVRDWGYAPDYVDAMRRMLQAAEPRDYVIASGQAHTVRQVCETAFGHVGLDWRAHVVVDQGLKRGARTGGPHREPHPGPNRAGVEADAGFPPADHRTGRR